MSEPNVIETFVFGILQEMQQLNSDEELVIAKKDGLFICYTKRPMFVISQRDFNECNFTFVDSSLVEGS